MILWGTAELEDGAVCSPVFVFIGGGEHIAAQAYTSVQFLGARKSCPGLVLICGANRGGVKYPCE